MKRLFLNLDNDMDEDNISNKKQIYPSFSPIQMTINYMDVHNLIDNYLTGQVNSIAKEIASNMIEKQDIFENIINTYKLIATNEIKKFDINEPYNPKYKTYVYTNGKQIAKIINYECGNLAEYMIIKEIAFQQYASELTNICDFDTPMILDYGKANSTNNRFDCNIFIIMNKIVYDNLLNAVDRIDLNNINICDSISNKLNTVNKCLEDNGLYHNDYHANNVMLNMNSDGNFRVGLIDYGEASSNYTTFKDWEYTCDKLRNIKRNKSPISVVFGGKNKKRTKKRRTKKKRSNKKRSNKRQSL
jgi:hypothetical protein